MQENADEYSLNLRPWLKLHLNKNDIACLQWIDKQQNVFKISWADKGKPGWLDTSVLYQAWAKHKDGDRNNQTFSTLKSRFRDAMRNSNSIVEIKERSVLNQQTGNFKVYKFLSAEQAEEKKKRQKRGRSSDGESSSPDSQGSSERLTLSQTSSDSQPALSMEHISALLDAADFTSPSESQGVDFDLVYPDPVSSAMNTSGICQLSPDDLGIFDPLSSAAPSAMVISEDVTPFSLQQTPQEECTESTSADVAAPQTTNNIGDLQLCLQNKTTKELLNVFGIDCTQLTQFLVTLEYDRHHICEYKMDFAHDIRFVHDGRVQNDHETRWPATRFPPYTEDNRLVKMALKNITDGVVITSVPGSLDLHGMRLGKGHIYYTNDEDKFVKMDRHVVTPLFSYLNYIQQALEHRGKQRLERPACEVVLSFGTCPPSNHSRSILVKLTIEPVVAASLREKFEVFSDGSSAILCSDDNTFDEMYRSLDEIRNSNKGTDNEEWKKYISP